MHWSGHVPIAPKLFENLSLVLSYTWDIMLTWFCYTKCPSQQRSIIKVDIKPTPVADFLSTDNLGDYGIPIPLPVSWGPLRGLSQKFLMSLFPEKSTSRILPIVYVKLSYSTLPRIGTFDPE